MIKTKKEFMKHIQNMEMPDIELGMDYYWDFLSCTFTLFDVNNHREKVDLLGCKLTGKEYNNLNLKNYYIRHAKLILKYKKWLLDANKPTPIYDYICVNQKYMSKIDDWFELETHQR